MTQLTILRYPDTRLHTIAKPVGVVDVRLRQRSPASRWTNFTRLAMKSLLY